ncbi:Neurotransmitter-gated ion-channel transmembrane region [Trichostrongylus colubriformis]|uniref:Neurotransmitter-gated ion-channel transmembrane region n=1 Tax=Trichostrongylus colubriformis TaxID=6319 RepID=A0AAN8GBF1_TRICO
MDFEGFSDLAQFSMTGFKVLNATNMTRDRNYSALEVRFYFERHFGYFLMNFYVPCTLIVLLCWVALWTNREATGDRVGMGITSVLTMVLIANDSKSDTPKSRRDGGRHSMYNRVSNMSLKRRLLVKKHSSTSNEVDDSTLEQFHHESVGWRLYFWMINNARHTDPFGLAQNSISVVDRFARIALPIYFVAVVTLYYNFYINTPYHFTFEDDTDIISSRLGSLLTFA